jgi:hypothetical protein
MIGAPAHYSLSLPQPAAPRRPWPSAPSPLVGRCSSSSRRQARSGKREGSLLSPLVGRAGTGDAGQEAARATVRCSSRLERRLDKLRPCLQAPARSVCSGEIGNLRVYLRPRGGLRRLRALAELGGALQINPGPLRRHTTPARSRSRDQIAFFRDLIAFSFLFRDLIAFLFSVQGAMYKNFNCQLR